MQRVAHNLFLSYDKANTKPKLTPLGASATISATVVFLTALLSSASPIKTISADATVADVALLGAIVISAAPEVAPPDKPEVADVLTAVISPSPIKLVHADPL